VFHHQIDFQRDQLSLTIQLFNEDVKLERKNFKGEEFDMSNEVRERMEANFGKSSPKCDLGCLLANLVAIEMKFFSSLPLPRYTSIQKCQ
jgi:hypothetical protein